MKNKFLKRLGISVCISSMILGSSVMANEKINKLSDIQISYTEANTDVTGKRSFSTYIKLTSTDCYAKVYYDNKSSENAQIVIKDDNNSTIKTLIISANSDDDFDWYGSGTYTIDLKTMEGSETLSGAISIASSSQDINNDGVNLQNENVSLYIDNCDLDVIITKNNKSSRVTTKYPYIKIWFENKGEGKATVHFQTTNGDTLGTLSVDAGLSDSIIYQGIAGGEYGYNITTKGGATDANGSLKIRSATTKEELE